METLTGIDVSHYQDNNETPQRIDWNKAKSAGARFAFIKAGQGSWQDSDFTYNWTESKRAGIKRGAYWYLDNRYDALAQAYKFMSIMSAAPDRGELPHVADYEMRDQRPSPITCRSRLLTFLNHVETASARVPIIYTGPAYWAEVGSTENFWRRHPLWIAHYEVSTPRVPLPWATWTFWQHTVKGDGPTFGMESLQVDLDYYQMGEGFDAIFLPPTLLTIAEKVNILWAAHPELHPR
jgi:lysozyme